MVMDTVRPDEMNDLSERMGGYYPELVSMLSLQHPDPKKSLYAAGNRIHAIRRPVSGAEISVGGYNVKFTESTSSPLRLNVGGVILDMSRDGLYFVYGNPDLTVVECLNGHIKRTTKRTPEKTTILPGYRNPPGEGIVAFITGFDEIVYAHVKGLSGSE